MTDTATLPRLRCPARTGSPLVRRLQAIVQHGLGGFRRGAGEVRRCRASGSSLSPSFSYSASRRCCSRSPSCSITGTRRRGERTGGCDVGRTLWRYGLGTRPQSMRPLVPRSRHSVGPCVHRRRLRRGRADPVRDATRVRRHGVRDAERARGIPDRWRCHRLRHLERDRAASGAGTGGQAPGVGSRPAPREMVGPRSMLDAGDQRHPAREDRRVLQGLRDRRRSRADRSGQPRVRRRRAIGHAH